ncbi:TPA: DNA polymerase I [Candidatus Dependentiae bacterium]|nr:MAG: polymerase I protein [candidate division TM6 bacterium GW2011_GWE2_31_21]KKP53203.1 MAG: polymerase I protein [candidate division TM6 bacterium GW2011_GWF2_33_332]HBS48021.1 DNA polymerase I [Candidatus Dependentiae bacterium]HBZ73375.1 DNA polymerase I [Candidatus Dependentiae bacterium]
MHRIKKDAIFLIDGSSFLYRAFYALKPLHTAKGLTVQAVFGFCRMIKKLIDDYNPQKIVLVWDTKGKTFRSEIFEEYKATRQKAPSDLIEQKKLIVEFADIIKLPQIFKEGYEADDLIASIAAENEDHETIIVSPDKDLQQLIDKRVLVFDPFKRIVIDKDDFQKINNFPPERTILYHSILGDASDNIPGVSGIGKKGAQELAEQFKSLDDLYENLEKVKSESLRKKLHEQKDLAFLSEKLFTLKIIKTHIKEKDLQFDAKNWNNAYDFFAKLNFESLLKGVKNPNETPKKNQEGQLSIFGGEKKETKEWKLIVVQEEDQLDSLIKDLKNCETFAFDTETTGLKPLEDDLVGISFAFDNKKAFYIPLKHQTEEKQLDRKMVLEKLKPILENKKIEKILHHAKFDELVLWQFGVDTKGVVFDSLIAAALLKKEGEKINLKILSLRYLDEPMATFADIMDKKYKTFAEVPLSIGAKYGAYDSLQTFKLKPLLEKELKAEPSLKKAFENIEMPISQILFKMERTGIKLDVEIIKEIAKELNKELNKLEAKILANIEHHGKEINLNSPKQIEVLLFDSLKLPVVKKSREGRRSTDQEVLEELSKIHPIPGLILRYRELFKLKSGYLEPLPLVINPKTNRIHTTFNQTDVATGRLSSNNPNLQNIPAAEGYGMKIRSAFEAGRGNIFISADYSQIDLRVLAHLTKDNALQKAFLEYRDIHTQTASQIFGVGENEVTQEQRQIGKRINFSIIYGLTPFGLSKDLGIKPSEAKIYIAKYFEQYPKVAVWMDKVVEEAKKKGYVETVFGKRRYVADLHEQNKHVYEAARRVTINTPVQGTSAEIIKLAMIKIDQELEKHDLNANMLLQIHDELIIELPKENEDKVTKIVQKCMENVVDWEIPLTVAIRSGKNWEDVSKS